MGTTLRIHRPEGASFDRLLAGLHIPSNCSRVDGAILAVLGAGRAAEVEIIAANSLAIPADLSKLFLLLDTASTQECSLRELASALGTLRIEFASLAVALLDELLATVEITAERLLAVGLTDPGLWCGPTARPVASLRVCDATALAERSGLNVIGGFADKDLIHGGQGGPLTALPYWMMMAGQTESRVLLDLGRTARITYLPCRRDANASAKLRGFDIGPGTALLDLLTQRLTAGQYKVDPGGHLAVQGRRLDALIEHWLRDPYFERPTPRWSPRGVRPERFLTDALQMAVEAGWSVRDLLCTANHFIAETVARTIRSRLPEGPNVDQVILAGGGQQNGMLLREIAQRLPGSPLLRMPELGLPTEAPEAAAAALLAALHIDQVPSNHMAISGTELPRVLGNLTPGAPRAWQRLLERMASVRPAVRSLRSAL